jgi:Ca2+-binding RTX toxin-like protein
VLDGGAGADDLFGAAGTDTLRGGSGDDRLSGVLRHAVSSQATLLYYEDLGRLVWDADGNGAGKGALLAVVEGHLRITLDDFLIV